MPAGSDIATYALAGVVAVVLLLVLAHTFGAKRVWSVLSGLASGRGKSAPLGEPAPANPVVKLSVVPAPQISAKYELSSLIVQHRLNQLVFRTGADGGYVIRAENGNGPPKPGCRMYTVVTHAVEVVDYNEWIIRWGAQPVTRHYANEVLHPLLAHGAVLLVTERLSDEILRDAYLSSRPPVLKSLVLLLSQRSNGVWYVSLHFSKPILPLTHELRNAIRVAAEVINANLPGAEGSDYLGVDSRSPNWAFVLEDPFFDQPPYSAQHRFGDATQSDAPPELPPE